MVDRSNLNRIKGILSARQGAEIPKFQQGAKFAMYNGKQVVYSNDNSSWFTDFNLTKVYSGSLSGYKSIQVPAQPPMQIPGDPEITPTTAIENSAKINAAAAEQVQTQVTAQQAVQQTNSDKLLEADFNAGKRYETIKSNVSPNVTPYTQVNLNNSLSLENTGVEEINSLKIANASKQEKANNVTQGIGQAASAAIQTVGQAVGAKQQVTDSDTTKTVDSVYNSAAQGLQQAGGVAGLVGTAMQFAGIAGDVIQELGGGTDQQTKTDKWMDSAFFSWNIGMLNGFAGKNTQNFGADQDILASVGSSYGGTTDSIMNAADKAGKKYGLFSTKARKKADAAINKARNQQNLMGDISDTAADQRLAVQSMGEQAGLAYSLMTDGGYNQKYTYAAKEGGVLEWNPIMELEWEPQIELNWELPTFKEGGNIDIVEELEWVPELQSGGKVTFNEWFNSIPNDYRAKGYDYQKAYEVFDWEDLRKHAEDPVKYHLRSVSPVVDSNGNYPFLKLGKLEENPEIQGEFDWYNSEDGKEHKAKFDIQYIGDRYYYTPKKFKSGGKTEEFDIPEIEETTQKNVIPEGALHKNKHHMEHAEGLTKKGIPVVDDDFEQQAEIEHSEIIFTLEVTKKLEEYYEIFYDDDSTNKEREQAALEAGKLLVYQILENTEDRTGLIESCKEGGTLTFKKTTDDLIEEVLEWAPTIVIVEETEVVEKPKKKENKDEKEIMKEAIKEVLIELLIK